MISKLVIYTDRDIITHVVVRGCVKEVASGVWSIGQRLEHINELPGDRVDQVRRNDVIGELLTLTSDRVELEWIVNGAPGAKVAGAKGRVRNYIERRLRFASPEPFISRE